MDPEFINIFLIFLILFFLSVIGYATWIQFIFPMYILPTFKLSPNKINLWKKYLVFILPIFALFLAWISAPPILQYIADRTSNTTTPPPAGIFSLILLLVSSLFLGLTSLPYLLVTLILKFTKKTKKFAKLNVTLALLTALGFIFGGTFILANILIGYGNAQASNFFVLNAAIKNTCFMDPKRIGCPQTLTELSYIEPEEFVRLSKTTQLLYEYYPDQNQYTFIARYAKNKAVIFDWRLVETDKIDFRVVEIDSWGNDHVKDPPNFVGPWENLPEWDKY